MINNWQQEDHAFFAFVVLSGASLAYVRDHCTRKSDGKKWISQEQYDHLRSQGLRNKRRCLERYQKRRVRDGPKASLEGWTLLPSNYDYSDYIDDSNSRLKRMTDELYNLQISPPATHSSNRSKMPPNTRSRSKKNRRPRGILKSPKSSGPPSQTVVCFDNKGNDCDESALNESMGALTTSSKAEQFTFGKLCTFNVDDADSVRELNVGVNGDDGCHLLVLNDVFTKDPNGDMVQMTVVAVVKPFSPLAMNENVLQLTTELVLIEEEDGSVRTAVLGTETIQVSRLDTDSGTISNNAGMQITVGEKVNKLKDADVS